MFKRWLICFIGCLGLFVSAPTYALKQKPATKHAVAAGNKKKVSQFGKQKKTASHKKSNSSKKKKAIAHKASKYSKKRKTFTNQQTNNKDAANTKAILSKEQTESAP